MVDRGLDRGVGFGKVDWLVAAAVVVGLRGKGEKKKGK